MKSNSMTRRPIKINGVIIGDIPCEHRNILRIGPEKGTGVREIKSNIPINLKNIASLFILDIITLKLKFNQN